MTTRTAACACGKLQVSCQGEPEIVSLCHCLDCQRRTGSAFGIVAFFPRDAVDAVGRTKTFTRSSDSGRTVTFHFCPDCGTTVYWEAKARPKSFGIAVGAFADPDFPAPSQSVWDERRHHWLPELD